MIIGPARLGDDVLSWNLLRRIALDFGTVMRAYTPIDSTLPKRLNASAVTPQHTPPLELKGEGLRPNENRERRAAEEEAAAQEAAQGLSLPEVLQGLMQGGMVQPGVDRPYVPFPVPVPNNNP